MVGDPPDGAEDFFPTQLTPVPPQDLDAEESVLGAMMLSPRVIEAVAGLVTAPDFYRDSHGVLYQRMVEMYEAGEPVDAVTLNNALERHGELDRGGGKVRIHELAALVPATANAPHYARIVHEMATLRALIAAGQDIARLGWERPGDTAELVDQAGQIAYNLNGGSNEGGLGHVANAVRAAYERIVIRFESGEEITGTPSGFHEIDRLAGGYEPGNMVVVAGRPSMGKTAFAVAAAHRLAIRKRIPVAIFTLEMSESELIQRLIACEAHIDSHRLKTGQLRNDEWGSLGKAASVIGESPIYIDDRGAASVTEIRTKVRRLKARCPDLGLVIVDYVQLMDTPGREDNRNQVISRISRGLKVMAGDLNVPVMVVSQLNRGVESRSDKRPILSDLRESGSLEQDADMVMFLYRDEYYNEDSDEIGIGQVILAKNRNGPTGTVKLAFLAPYATFSDLAVLR